MATSIILSDFDPFTSHAHLTDYFHLARVSHRYHNIISQTAVYHQRNELYVSCYDCRIKNLIDARIVMQLASYRNMVGVL